MYSQGMWLYLQNKLYYEKGNYAGLREFVWTKMQDLINWCRYYVGLLHKGTTWIENTYIPKTRVKVNKTGNWKTRQSAYDERALSKIKEKHRAW